MYSIRNIGWGNYVATNGIDKVEAKAIRGKKRRLTWHLYLLIDGKNDCGCKPYMHKTLEAGSGAYEMERGMKELLFAERKPDVSECKRMQDEFGYVFGSVNVPVCEMVGRTNEDLTAYLTGKVFPGEIAACITHPKYHVIGTTPEEEKLLCRVEATCAI